MVESTSRGSGRDALSDEERGEEREEDQEHEEERRREEHIGEERAREEHEEETERVEQHEEEEKIDERDEAAESEILETLGREEVATDRELKVRLEDDFFPWVVGRAIRRLFDGEAIDKVGYPGRRRKVGRGEVGAFYVPYGVEYDSVKEIIKRKKDASDGIANILMGGSSVSGHVEDLFYDAFVSLGFKFGGRDVSTLGERKAVGVPGKEPPNVDFVFERDGIRYGIDVKNWIRYEWITRKDVVSKVKVAKELGVVPFIVARYADKDVVYKEIVEKGGLVYSYRHLLVPSVYESLAKAAQELLGYPILAVDKLPDFKVEWIGKLHSALVNRVRV
jgi:hypothetical protein